MTAGNAIITLTDQLRKKLEKFEADLEEIDRILDEEIQVLIREETERAEQDARRSGQLAVFFILSSGFLVFVAVAGVGRFTSKKISDGVSRLTDGASEFGQGNFDHRI